MTVIFMFPGQLGKISTSRSMFAILGLLVSSHKLLYPLKQHQAYVNPVTDTGLILGMRPANERPRYFVTASLIGWVQT